MKKDPINEIIDIFYQYSRNNRLFANKTQRQAVEDLIKEFSFEQIKDYSEKCVEFMKDTQINYAPVIDTPLKLQQRMGSLITYINKSKSPIKPQYREKFDVKEIGGTKWKDGETMKIFN
jgi:hypothetical protein